MERPIMKDVLFLQQPSEPATQEDKALILDLQDPSFKWQKQKFSGQIALIMNDLSE